MLERSGIFNIMDFSQEQGKTYQPVKFKYFKEKTKECFKDIFGREMPNHVYDTMDVTRIAPVCNMDELEDDKTLTPYGILIVIYYRSGINAVYKEMNIHNLPNISMLVPLRYFLNHRYFVRGSVITEEVNLRLLFEYLRDIRKIYHKGA